MFNSACCAAYSWIRGCRLSVVAENLRICAAVQAESEQDSPGEGEGRAFIDNRRVYQIIVIRDIFVMRQLLFNLIFTETSLPESVPALR